MSDKNAFENKAKAKKNKLLSARNPCFSVVSGNRKFTVFQNYLQAVDIK